VTNSEEKKRLKSLRLSQLYEIKKKKNYKLPFWLATKTTTTGPADTTKNKAISWKSTSKLFII